MVGKIHVLALPLLLLLGSRICAEPDPDHPLSETQGVLAQPYGASNWQWGKELFWYKGDTSSFGAYRTYADQLSRQGIAPVMSAVMFAGSNRWGDTTIDTTIAFQHRDPAWVAYTYWEYAHDSLTSVGPNGNYVSTLGSAADGGWISPATPLPASDCPDNMTHCVWGDWAAERVARMCQATHMVGMAAADGVDGMPGPIATEIDFNPRILQAFGDSIGMVIPGATIAAQATYITTKLMPQWVSFWDGAWAHFYSETARKIKLYTGVEPLISAQCAWDVTYRRWMGVDFRHYYAAMPDPKAWYFGIEMQGDNLRAMDDNGTLIGIFGTYCAWEPSIHLGVKLNIDDTYLQQSLTLAHIPLRDTASMYDTQWFLEGFAHVAGRDGKLRRAAQAFQYGYSDQTNLAKPGVTEAIWAHIPRRAYGPAFFFSDTMIRSWESQGKIWSIDADADTAWKHCPHGYYVSDAALDSLKPSAVPTCWIVTRPATLIAAERAKLEKFAPVVSADSAALLAPIHASGKGKAWGFVDQDSSLVVVVSNMDTVPSTITVTVGGLPEWAIPLYDGLADTLLSVLPGSSTPTRTFTIHLASRDTKPFVLMNAFMDMSSVLPKENPGRHPGPELNLLHANSGAVFPRFARNGTLAGWVDASGHPSLAPSTR
jgi:hypothetical protein